MSRISWVTALALEKGARVVDEGGSISSFMYLGTAAYTRTHT
jgi:hypothetical protein